MVKWIKNKMIWLMMALHKTEGNIANEKDELILTSGKYQSHKAGMLSESLVNGELTQEVKELRWRIYKIIQHTQGVKTEITGTDEDGYPIVTTLRTEGTPLKGFKGDQVDKHPVRLVVSNRTIDVGTTDAMGKLGDNFDDISFDDYQSKFKGSKSLYIKRDFQPMFEIEKYTTKMVVKEIVETGKFILEFYVNKYPNVEDRRSRLFLSELTKVINGKHNSNITDIQGVLFITDNTLGARDFLEYEFSIDKFHRITEYDGNYLIKFLADKVVYGDDVLDKFKIESLDIKYENKEKK